MARTLLLAATFLFALLAGCAQQNGSSDGATTADPGVDVEATETTGVIKGVVVDLAIKPLQNAVVTVKSAGKTLTNTTNSVGGFGFEGLEPGTYFITASKSGYKTGQASAEVVAGDSNPPTKRITLEADGTAVTPHYNLQKHVGFIECTTSLLVLCGAPNLLTGQQITPDAFTWDQHFEDNATMIQTEMTWESSQALSPELYFEMELLNGGCDPEDSSFVNSTSGPSPIWTRVFGARIAQDKIGSVCPIYYSVFSGGATGVPCTPPIPGVLGDVCAGVTVEQKFETYMIDFHGFLPPTDYLFVRDGAPKVPPA